MIDRIARDKLAERLRHLATGLITNYQFEDQAKRSSDRVIHDIEFRLAWPAYDDMHEHKLKGQHAISLGHRLDFARAILFLKSDLPYEWKRFSGFRAFLNSTFRLIPFTRKAPLDISQGDLRVWPFFRYSDYRDALARQPYLNSPQEAQQDAAANP